MSEPMSAALRNVASVMMEYTEVTRDHNGRGRPPTYAARVDAIAQTGRQLAEMALANEDDNDRLRTELAAAREREDALRAFVEEMAVFSPVAPIQYLERAIIKARALLARSSATGDEGEGQGPAG